MQRLNPDLQYSVICDDVRQERNGKFILIGLFDVVGGTQMPTVFPRICVVNRWCSGQGRFRTRTRLAAPDGSRMIAEGREIEVDLPNPEHSVTNIEFFLNVNFAAEGTYWVEILLDDDLKLRYPLRVNKVQPPRQGTSEGPLPA